VRLEPLTVQQSFSRKCQLGNIGRRKQLPPSCPAGSRSYGRSRRPRQHEAFDCHAFKRNRQEECVQMPVKIARSAPRPAFGLLELLVAIHTSRQSCYEAGKARIFTPVRE